MKTFKDTITLNKNKRGCYIIDTIKGCSYLNINFKGCYGDCYANKISSRYGFDFKNPVKRDFKRDTKQLYLLNFYDTSHENKIIRKIENIEMPFVRIGEMGDPSEDWKHTIDVCKIISDAKKQIVITTKHWKTIPDYLLKPIEKLNICINTSISALDNINEIKHRLKQFNRLKNYCESVLRIVSCSFNINNNQGYLKSVIQNELFKNQSIIDTVFRPSLNNDFVTNKIINTKKIKFLKSKVYASVFNSKTYFGYCKNCPDMCGVKF